MIPDIAMRALKTYYGYDDFRPAQKPVVEHLLQGKDCLAIMPTGAGKSICFQIPAVVRKGVTIVFTPLISLMKDQVDGLRMQRVPATYINSSLPLEEINKRMYQVRMNRIKLLYIAPEKLAAEGFCRFLRGVPIAQVIIDEAHCVSQWGHDFRPAYRDIAPFVASLPVKPIVGAFTATATKEVEEDIKKLLGLTHKDAKIFKLGFDRPNLSFSVLHVKDRLTYTVDYVKAHATESGVIYCATRKDVEAVYQRLVAEGVTAGYYHAGLSDAHRKQEQERYANDDISVIVATNAFGMGIDKSNVRYVLHYQMPRNMEGYYQEAGRAGRDGAEAECILLYSGRDVMIHKFLINQSVQEPERKRVELERLQAMTDYCYTSTCLRKYILAYFGETVTWQSCHHCSVCAQGQQQQNMTEEAKCIFRAISATEERFGSGMITDIVIGNRTDRILKGGYHRLSSFGRLERMGEREVKEFIKQLIATGYLHVATGKYPLLGLTAGAEHVLAGYGTVLQPKVRVIQSPRKSMNQQARTRAISSGSSSLFEQLRTIRKKVAAEQKVPPYLIFPDTVLIDMASQKPRTMADLYSIKGIGENKLKKYGMTFLKAIAEYEGRHT